MIAVVPPAFVVSEASAVVVPTAPVKVVVALSFTVRAPGPFTVLAKVLPTPVSVVAPPRVTASL